MNKPIPPPLETGRLFADEMRLFDNDSNRLYVDSRERELFLEEAKNLPEPKHRLFCEVLHWTGCRISEAMELTPRRIEINARAIKFRTLKRREFTRSGKKKNPEYRLVPVPNELIENLDLAFGVRKAHRSQKGLDDLFWPNANDPKKPMSRTTGWNIIKRVFEKLGIKGAHTTPKGFRHGYGVAMTLAGMDVYKIQQFLGHSSADTTQIYRQAIGYENHQYAMSYWEKLAELTQR